MTAGRLPFQHRNPFIESLGFELSGLGEGRAELRVEIGEGHLNSWGVAHGGVLMTLLDVAMAHAARSVGVWPDTARGAGGGQDPARHLAQGQADSAPGVATVEMKTSFVRPAEGPLRAEGRLLHKTSTLAFCEASVRDAAGHLCAHATGTFMFLRALPSAGRQLRTLQRAPPDVGEGPAA